MQIVLQSAVAVDFSLVDITDYHQLEPMASNFTLIIPSNEWAHLHLPELW
jgi:hypothetical protein